MSTRRPLLAMVLSAHFLALPAAATTITIVNVDAAGVGFNDPTPRAPVGGNTGTTLGQQRLNVFQYVASLWSQRLDSTVEIKVRASWTALTCSPASAVLGSAGTRTIHRGFAGAPLAGTWYPAALANKLAGTDLNPPGSDAGEDIQAVFTTALDDGSCGFPMTWYYGLDGDPTPGTTDFASVVLHEVGHGLGFQTFVDRTTGAKLNGYDDAYMVNLYDATTGKTWPAMTDAERVASSTNTGNLLWNGSAVTAVAAGVLAAGTGAGNRARMYAPNPYKSGSSVSHWDTALSPNEILEPSYTGVNHCLLLTDELFSDIGWGVVVGSPCLHGIASPIVAGSTNTFDGLGFTPGSVLKLFVSTASGPVDTNPAGWTPTTQNSTQLTWNVPPSVSLGQGFATVQVVNTDQGYASSNLRSHLLYGDAADGLPTILTIGGVGLSEPAPSLPGAHVEKVLAANAATTITGTGFSGPVVNLFTADGNLGPLLPQAGGSSTSFQVVVPAGIPAGPGTFQVVNTGAGFTSSNAVDAVLRAQVTVTSVNVSGSTVNVVGNGFCGLTVINLFNVQGGNVVNLGGLSGGSAVIPINVTDAQHLSFTLPAGAQSGPAYVQALNPPYTPFTSSGTDPGGAFTVP